MSCLDLAIIIVGVEPRPCVKLLVVFDPVTLYIPNPASVLILADGLIKPPVTVGV